MGMLGPVRVKLDSDAKTLPPPHELTNNEFSLLDITDLVFVDPVSTGFSRPAKGEDKRQFHGYDEDLRSVAQFIHDYTTKYARWDSPKFLIGESYGGLRAAGLSGELQNRYRMFLNGIVLVSAVVDFQTLAAGGHNDIAYALFLPTYATTAWYHKALSDELQKLSVDEVMRQAERFAGGQYLRALAAGDALGKERRQQVVERMSELTGLSKDYLEAANLRVPMFRFGKELLRKRGLIVGRFDSRYTGRSLDRVNDSTEYDPSASAVFGSFTSAFNDYIRRTLKVEEERVYEILTDRVHPWDYSEFTNRYVDASETLRTAMTQNPFLQVYAACGYYDLATPTFAMEYTRDHLNLSDELRDNFSLGFYEGGHMMYAHEPSLKKLRDDLVKFYDKALKPLDKSDDEGK
jgi:carboxypeptidase C (cathepsin A)